MAREKREARMNIQAFLQADADAQHIRMKRKFLKGEIFTAVVQLAPLCTDTDMCMCDNDIVLYVRKLTAVAVLNYTLDFAEEEEIMGHVPGWKIGASVYKSGIYMAPTLNMGWPDDLISS
jgi:Fe-S cluster assembly iron-binding protein IscA